MLIVGSCAIVVREPCQILTEAALNGKGGVPRERLKGVTYRCAVRKCFVEQRVRGISFKKTTEGRAAIESYCGASFVLVRSDSSPTKHVKPVEAYELKSRRVLRLHPDTFRYSKILIENGIVARKQFCYVIYASA